MSELTNERRLEILQSLGSTSCGGCGGAKKPKMSHCRTCYFHLPLRMRKALYRDFGDGYEEAYEASLSYLKELKQAAAKHPGYLGLILIAFIGGLMVRPLGGCMRRWKSEARSVWSLRIYFARRNVQKERKNTAHTLAQVARRIVTLATSARHFH